MHDTLIFDLDGTLVHSAPDMAHSLNHTLARYGAGPLTMETVSGLVGNGIAKLVERGFQASGSGLEKSEMEEAIRTFEAHYGENAVVDTALYPGAKSVLEALLADGMTLAICTNKTEPIAEDILAKLHIAHCFEAVLGGHAKWPRKPDPAPLLQAVNKSGGAPGRALMIGDSKIDLDAARAAGIPVILTSFGYSQVPVDQLGPDAVIDSLKELPQALASLRVRAGTG
jgi:phosphoglycolate phosphatase